MVPATASPLLMFMALLALFSPLAALSAYMPVVGRYRPADQRRLALRLALNVAIFVLAAVWIGEPLLELLGISTAALSVTGGIALLCAGIPMMRGIGEAAVEPTTDASADVAPPAAAKDDDWNAVLFSPLTFPLTVGGTSFGLIVAFSSSSEGLSDDIEYTLAGLAYAVVTGVTAYLAAHLHRRISVKARLIMSRVAGILLTAIAVSLLANGGTRLVVATLQALGKL